MGRANISKSRQKTMILKPFLPHQVPMSKEADEIRYEKIVIIKEDDFDNLRTRLNELLKHEECKLVNFGVFSK